MLKISPAINGVVVEDDIWNRNVGYGVEMVIFGGLIPEVAYYFKIISYKGIAEEVDYKVDGSVPEVSIRAR